MEGKGFNQAAEAECDVARAPLTSFCSRRRPGTSLLPWPGGMGGRRGGDADAAKQCLTATPLMWKRADQQELEGQ